VAVSIELRQQQIEGILCQIPFAFWDWRGFHCFSGLEESEKLFRRGM
jgi:hypothetical protein